MKKFLRRRGQATVEFTLLLPFFALVLFATIYIGFFVLDYVTLDNAAAASARAAALNVAENYIIPGEDTKASGTVWKRAHDTDLFFTWYTVDINSPTSQIGYYDAEDNFIPLTYYVIDEDTSYFAPTGYETSSGAPNDPYQPEYVQVKIKANWNKSGEHILTGILPEEGYTVLKTARIEP